MLQLLYVAPRLAAMRGRCKKLKAQMYNLDKLRKWTNWLRREAGGYRQGYTHFCALDTRVKYRMTGCHTLILTYLLGVKTDIRKRLGSKMEFEINFAFDEIKVAYSGQCNMDIAPAAVRTPATGLSYSVPGHRSTARSRSLWHSPLQIALLHPGPGRKLYSCARGLGVSPFQASRVARNLFGVNATEQWTGIGGLGGLGGWWWLT